jgi:hypothetical protein
MKDIFNQTITSEFIDRINSLNPTSQPKWGKMSVEKMLAHCNVAYEMAFENMHQKPNAFKKFFIKLLVKNYIVNDIPFKKNVHTAPDFIIKSEKNFDIEKKRLIDYLIKTQQLGAAYFEGKESHSFGPLTKHEWNNMFSKHLDHHLNQFGV